MDKTFVITARAENGLRVLQKIASLMTRKRLKVKKLTIHESDVSGEALLALTLQEKEARVQWLMKQLGKFVDLFDLVLESAVDTLLDEKCDNPLKSEIASRFGVIRPFYYKYNNQL